MEVALVLGGTLVALYLYSKSKQKDDPQGTDSGDGTGSGSSDSGAGSGTGTGGGSGSAAPLPTSLITPPPQAPGVKRCGDQFFFDPNTRQVVSSYQLTIAGKPDTPVVYPNGTYFFRQSGPDCP